MHTICNTVVKIGKSYQREEKKTVSFYSEALPNYKEFDRNNPTDEYDHREVLFKITMQ
jgi:hypothetical protein